MERIFYLCTSSVAECSLVAQFAEAAGSPKAKAKALSAGVAFFATGSSQVI